MSTPMHVTTALTMAIVALSAILLLSASACPAEQDAGRPKPAPTHKDMAYGPYAANVLDLWLAEFEQPTPLVLFIHGGGFRGGTKDGFPAETLERFLDAGISLAAVEYRLLPEVKLPQTHHDCRRALQFLRAKAADFNLDKTRVGAFGGSAGAQICMWLGFHDDMAEPDSDDPLERESTRLACVATNGGQTTMDFTWWQEWIPGYDKPHRDPLETFKAKDEETIRAIVQDVSALSLISDDDPPIWMSYGQRPTDPVPADPERAQGWKVHHVMFGVKLKEKMDELGLEAYLQYPGATPKYPTREAFLIAKLTAE